MKHPAFKKKHDHLRMMKFALLTISLLIVTLSLSGQPVEDTIVSIRYIDSLKREVANLKERNNSLFWRFHEKISVTEIDTLFIRPDSLVITYLLKDGKPLKKQFNILDQKGEIVRYSNHYFDNKQQLKYVENWVNLKDDVFDAKLSSAERIEYDSLGRQVLTVTYYQSARRTIRRTYWYDETGAKQSKADMIKSYAMWDE